MYAGRNATLAASVGSGPERIPTPRRWRRASPAPSATRQPFAGHLSGGYTVPFAQPCHASFRGQTSWPFVGQRCSACGDG